MKAATEPTIRKYCPSRISIHAAREGGDGHPAFQAVQIDISIHAAREGGDAGAYIDELSEIPISIHAAREGGDVGRAIISVSISDFNPRRP